MRVKIHDETAAGRVVSALELDVSGPVRLRELIRLRVREEVARYNARPVERFQGLVRPTAAEADLNGYRMATPARIDWEQQADAALTAFDRNGFFVLVGDRQVEDLDEELTLDEAARVVFIRLVQLVGG
ncbi:hypothetical protein AB0K00_47650 [Dactylosporangium sp. NPDC049525]|uniref:hypothetical protein n=1 Tax=Dactylosporangium sp. NPDC049525 TaxID=3154730 RepID=UPI00343511E4